MESAGENAERTYWEGSGEEVSGPWSRWARVRKGLMERESAREADEPKMMGWDHGVGGRGCGTDLWGGIVRGADEPKNGWVHGVRGRGRLGTSGRSPLGLEAEALGLGTQ